MSHGAVPFLPRDGNDTSVGVLKVTGTTPQIGFDGFFLPTAVIDQAGPHSIYPGLKLPRALLSVYTGDLGVDSGTPQSVYSLDKNGLTQVRAKDGRKLVVGLAPHTSVTLPSGETITMDGVRRWTSLSIARDPGAGPGAGVRAAGAGRPDDVAVRAAPAGLGPGCGRRRRAYARRGGGAGADRGRGRRGPDRRGPPAGRADRGQVGTTS